MRISSIKLAGFRGVRNTLEIPCGSGFTVICGPNGSGKSTICDALEFLLTGTLERFAVETERREYISDYLWWRGPSQNHAGTVQIEFMADNGHRLTLERTESDDSQERDASPLIDEARAPVDWQRQLCLTSILRDDTITKFSTDQSERERSEFTLSSIGLAGSIAIEQKLGDVLKAIDTALSERTAQYNEQRTRVERWISELSQARSSATKASDEQTAHLRSRYPEEFAKTLGDPRALIRSIAEQEASLKRRVEALTRLRRANKELQDERGDTQTEAFNNKLNDLRTQLEVSNRSAVEARQQKEDLDQRLRSEQANSPLVRSLAAIREYGQALGLLEGRCPLCGSEISEAEFKDHLAHIQASVNESSASLSELTRDNRLASERLSGVETTLAAIGAELRKLQGASARLVEREVELAKLAASLTVTLTDDDIALEIDRTSERAAQCSNDLAVLQAMVAAHRVVELEELVKGASQRAELTEQDVNKISRARLRAIEARDIVKRVSTEVIAERLAFLQPSLVEFCDRLKPHPEWAPVEILLRGDVRPFVSFLTGQNLNPRFVFSSGQRRALGLAFLLAVHLSRTWCKLQTLILDDPVQHIDDYRALHLVETLASMRMIGKQIICTIEDPALADLLCRRLRSSGLSEGMRIDLDYTVGRGVTIRETRLVPPLVEAALAAD